MLGSIKTSEKQILWPRPPRRGEREEQTGVQSGRESSPCARPGAAPAPLPSPAAKPRRSVPAFLPKLLWRRWCDRHVPREGDRAAPGVPVPAASPCAAPAGLVTEGTPRDVTAAAGSPSLQHLLNNPFKSAPLVFFSPFFPSADSSRLLGRRRPGYGTLQPDAEKSRMVGPASPRGGRHKNRVLSAKTAASQPRNDLVATSLVSSRARRLGSFMGLGAW